MSGVEDARGRTSGTRTWSTWLRVGLCLCGLLVGGCSKRKGPETPVSTRPAPAAAEGAGFETAGGPAGALLAGDLPLGERLEDMGSYLELDETRGGAAGEGGVGRLPPGALEALEDVLFSFDSYQLSPEARQQLAGAGSYLAAHAEIELVIEGHCDSRGTAAYNLVLGERRALAVREFLAAMRVAPGRMMTVSFGEERPLDPRPIEDAYQRNRRAHFRARVR